MVSIKRIICAMRGQPEGRKTVTRAIDLALEHDAHLTFCLIISVEFLGKSAPTLTSLQAAYRQLEDIGEFSMLILCDVRNDAALKRLIFNSEEGKSPSNCACWSPKQKQKLWF